MPWGDNLPQYGALNQVGSQLQNLFTPQSLGMLNSYLQPYFNQQQSALGNAQQSALGNASRGASAYASSRGYDNPFSFIQQARGNVYSQYAPQFSSLLSGQLGQLLGTEGQRGNALQGAGGVYNSMLNREFQNYQLNNQPSFLEDLLGKIAQGAGQAGGTALMASDRRLKKNLVKIGQTKHGTNIYEWDWKFGGKGFGVIAQEVPEASVEIDGVLFVDYSMVK